MNKTFFLFLVFWLLEGSSINVSADPNIFFSCTRRLETIVGTIEGIRLNTLDIRDEQDRQVKSFVYFPADSNQFRKGDRVRIYFRCRDGFIESIKTMTPVKYKKEGQYAWYLLKK